MKVASVFLLFFAVVLVNSSHVFLGTNVQRPLVHLEKVRYGAHVFRKRVEYFKFVLPSTPTQFGRVIQGIMAYDINDSGASANVTEGGVGTNTVTLRMKSDRGKPLNYDVYIYA